MRRAIRTLRRLRRDSFGIAAVEFAILVPVLVAFLVGAFDIAHTLYMKSVLQGAMQKAARDTSLETGTSAAQRTAVDTRLRTSVRLVNGAIAAADIKITRRFWRTFSEAAAARREEFTDTNRNGICDGNNPTNPTDGEPFDDRNSNGVRDLDGGDEGQGGAKDAVLYTVSLDYPRLLPLHRFAPVPARIQLSASTILKNQPYSDQEAYGTATVGHCGP